MPRGNGLLLVLTLVAIAVAADGSRREAGTRDEDIMLIDTGGLFAEAGGVYEGSGDDEGDAGESLISAREQQPLSAALLSTQAADTISVDDPESTVSSAAPPASTEVKQTTAGPAETRLSPKADLPGRWHEGSWSECSATCGEGLRSRAVTCTSSGTTDGDRPTLEDAACIGTDKPATTQSCWLTACQPIWYHSEWGSCAGACGGRGVQQRFVFCGKEEYDDGKLPRLLPDSACHAYSLSPPPKEQPCEVIECQQWHASNWSLCNSVCGRGERMRKVVCRGYDGRLLDDEACVHLPKPVGVDACEAAVPCGGVDWVVSDWSECKGGCRGARGSQTRQVACAGTNGHLHPDEKCNVATRPVESKDCTAPSWQCSAAEDRAKAEWFTSEWTACSASCGKGQQTRTVVCLLRQPNGAAHVVVDSECSTELRRTITTHRGCSAATPCSAEWYTSRYSECIWNQDEQTAHSVRRTFCLPSAYNVPPVDSDCPAASRPDAQEPCGTDTGKDYRLLHERCTVSEHGCCADGITAALGPAFAGCLQKDNAVDCSVSLFGCCPDGVTSAVGPFFLGCPVVHSCKDTRYGCCGDGRTPATGDSGPDADSCNAIASCFDSEWGCCPGQTAPAQGPNSWGCSAEAPKAVPVEDHTRKGSCKEDGEGCAERSPLEIAAEKGCSRSEHGCCPDRVTFASGPSSAGCSTVTQAPVIETPAEHAVVTDADIRVTEEMIRTVKACTTGDGPNKCHTDTTPARHVEAPDEEMTELSVSSNTGAGKEIVEETIVPAIQKPYIEVAVTDPHENEADLTTQPEHVTDRPAANATATSQSHKVCHAPKDLVVTNEPTEDDVTIVNINWQPPSPTYGLSEALRLIYTVYYSENAYLPLDEWNQVTTYQTSLQLSLDANTTYFFKASAQVEGSDLQGPTSYVYRYTTTEDTGMTLQGGCHATQYGCCRDGLTSATGQRQSGCPVTMTMDVSTANKKPTSLPAAHIISAPRDFNATGLSQSDVGVLTRMSWQAPLPESIAVDYYVLYYVDDYQRPLSEWQTLVLRETSVTATFPRSINVYFRVRANGVANDGPLSDVYHFVSEEGSHCQAIRRACSETEHGCCPDGVTAAAGANALECPSIDTHTAATTEEPVAGPPLVGGCRGTRWGCCSDGRTSALGPDMLGCRGDPQPCDVTEFGCCMDGSTAAEGPEFKGCAEAPSAKSAATGCIRSFYGCCHDGETPATGPMMAGCLKQERKGDICALTWDVGPESNYSVKWYYDVLNGVCRRFWYGGLGGNENRFEDERECKATCVQPEGTGVCFLPPSTGRCQMSLNRWYYDSRAGVCRQFTYGGCFGNKNNFRTREECDLSCKIPLRTDTCSLPQVTGPCRGQFSRWYYDSSRGVCEQFTYGGCGGNANRFTTPEDCQKRCVNRDAKDVCTMPIEQGPCRASMPRWAFDAKMGSCRQFVYGGCRGNANNFETQEECSDVCGHRRLTMRDVCRMEPDGGSCGGNVTQYHYDHRHGICRAFTYSGCEGNANRFESSEECMKSCRRHLADAKFSTDSCLRNPIDDDTCSLASPSVDHGARRYMYDLSDGLCKPLTSSCNGTAEDNVFESGEACEHACAAQYDNVVADDDVCKLPEDIGQCLVSNYQTRWTYDSKDGACKRFLYSGCRGNRNNFPTEEACLGRCQPHPALPEDVCTLPNDVGSCHGSFPRYFFDQAAGVCRQFNYTGCGGNANKFTVAEDCSALCAPRGASMPRAGHDVCTQPMEVGPCRAAFPRWHFDTELHKCVQFTYGGCRGNGNNFHSQEECEKRCELRDPAHIDVCSLPVVAGPCFMWLTRWHFDKNEHKCIRFTYGGCRGNGNRFLSEAECASRCGGSDASAIAVEVPVVTDVLVTFTEAEAVSTTVTTGVPATEHSERKPDEACNLPLARGSSCDSTSESRSALRFYYDSSSKACRPYVYSGCDGNENSFESARACAAACQSPSLTGQAAEQSGLLSRRDCFETPDAGHCSGTEARYYYDHKRGTCELFYYGGCSGNRNNFLSAEDCTSFCHTETSQCPKLNCPAETRDSRRCPHGFAFSSDGCPTCDCHDPCSTLDCPSGTRCLVSAPQCPDFDSATCQTSQPVCMPVIKSGECPLVNDTTAFESCGEQAACDDDASCSGDRKCCNSDACGFVCVGHDAGHGSPRSGTGQDGCSTSAYGCCLDGITPAKGYGYKGCPERRPRILRPSGHGSQYVASVGEALQLPCIAQASPAPRIDWYRNRKPILFESDTRLSLLANGSLLISPLTLEDNAEYICRAYNGIGDPAYEYLTIQVRDHVMIMESSTSIVSERGSAVQLHCRASGSPAPTISWIFDGKTLTFDQGEAGRISQLDDGSLIIHKLTEADEGDYVCYAQNSVNSASKVIAVSIEEPLAAELSSTRSTAVSGTNLELQCQVRGYPPPKVSWTLNGEPLPYEDRLVINGNTLTISDTRESDTGNYTCTADNGKQVVELVAIVTILPPPTTEPPSTTAPVTFVPASCQDRPLLANCSLIVRYKYCGHPMYKVFCCRSCYLDALQNPTPRARPTAATVPAIDGAK